MTTSPRQTPRQTMDFFQHQDRAKAQSKKFVLLYATAVIAICITLAIIAFTIVYFSAQEPNQSATLPALAAAAITAIVTALLIGAGSAHRISELKGGGSTVARSLGGILIDPSTRDPHQRQLLNIVEEMSIASGVPVPPVYIMSNERGINAFAAGYTPGDAVIGVTQGCIEGLKRDELQGVIAHEFSHILNGDMKLNIRMIGFLNGILLLTILGHILLRYAPYTARDKNGVPILLVMLALAISMLILGSLGALAAKLIQASVSRQREFLADASAVQFTRNPEGIANALRRLGAKPSATKVKHPRAQESAHMFFGEALKLGSSLATHPPLALRIKRINPQWDGTFLPPLEIQAPEPDTKKPSAQERLRDQFNKRMGSAIPESMTAAIPLLALSGSLTPDHIDHARTIIQSIPEPLKDAAHDISSSRAVVYALLLDTKDARIFTEQINHLSKHADPAVAKLTEKLATAATTLKPELRLPLLDMTLASLAHLSDPQHKTFRNNITALINMDSAVTLFEWVTIKVLTRHLQQRFASPPRTPVQYYALNKLTTEVSTLLSIIARTDTPTDSSSESVAADAIKLANTALPSSTKAPNAPIATLLPEDQCTLDNLGSALKTLNTAAPKLKRAILHAATLTAAHDRIITTTEAELIRAIADTLSVPVPPLLPNQQLA